MYIVRTSIDDEKKASIIAREIVESRSAVSVHIRRIESVYSWQDDVYNEVEWEIESITSCPSEVENIVRGMHPYNLPEFIIIQLLANAEIKNWCEGWCKSTEIIKSEE